MADKKDEALAARSPAHPAHLAPLLDGFKRLYVSKDYADVTITCQRQEFKAHKFVLCAQSEYFQKMFGSGFKEAVEGKVVLDDESPQVMEALIHYLYNFDYGEYTNRETDVSPIVLDVRMHAIAEKYFIEPLKKLSTAKFEARVKKEWCTDAFADAVAEIYENTVKEGPIKMIALATIRSKSNELLPKNGPYATFSKILDETAELGADLARSLEYSSQITKYKCPGCDNVFELAHARGCYIGCGECNDYDNKSLSFWALHQVAE